MNTELIPDLLWFRLKQLSPKQSKIGFNSHALKGDTFGCRPQKGERTLLFEIDPKGSI